MIFIFPLEYKRETNLKSIKHKWRHLHLCFHTSVFLVSTNGKLYFKSCQILPMLHYSILLHYKRKRRTDTLSLSSRTPGERLRHLIWLWGKCVTFININGSALRWKNRLHVLKCLSDDAHELEKGFLSYAHCCSTRTTNHSGLSFQDSSSIQSFQNARAEKDVMVKRCNVPGMAHRSDIEREGFPETLSLDHCKKKDS